MKNRYEVRGDTTIIYINRRNSPNLEVLVSTRHLKRLLKLKGTFSAYNKGEYFKMEHLKDGKRKSILLHRFLTNAPKGMDVDHIDGNTLDNTDSNLRVATRSQNNQNAKSKNPASGVKGVYFHKGQGTWYGQVVLNYKTHHTGHFKDKADCIEAVRQLREKLHPYATDRAF